MGMEEIDKILFETFMGKGFKGERLEQVQRTTHEMKQWNLREKGRSCAIKMGIRMLNLLEGAEGQ